MPRLSNGNWQDYTPGNPVVTNTTISSAWWNGTYADLGNAIAGSLSRDGLGGMRVPFTLVDGTSSAPAFAFQLENTTGFYRANPGDMRVSVLGADVFEWTSTAVTALESMVVTGTASTTGLAATGGAGNADGVSGTATGTGAGVHGFSTSTSGSVALVGTGTGSQLGLLATSSAANIDVARFDGYLSMASATNPVPTAGFTNHLTPRNLVKAWAYVLTDGSGGVALKNGFNIASASISATDMTVNYTNAMADTFYVCMVQATAASASPKTMVMAVPSTHLVGSTTFVLRNWTTPSVNLDPQTDSFAVELVVLGAQ